MTRDQEIAAMRTNLRTQAEQVADLLDLASRTARPGSDPGAAEAGLALMESILLKHHWQLLHMQAARRAQAA
jgi:hypothetical protein